jgi:hypothetical protein
VYLLVCTEVRPVQLALSCDGDLAHATLCCITIVAALPHIFNAAIGAPNCCSVVEIFPERAKGFSDIEGFGNIARLLGMNYQRYVVDDGHSSKVGGSTVSLSALLPLIKEAAMSASRRTICRHDVLPLGEPLQCNTTSHSKVLYKVL